MLSEWIAQSLGLSPRYITRLASTASHRYKHFTVAKAGGGERNIYHPAKPLKALQRWLQINIVSKFDVHEAAAAYRSGRNIADHARVHLQGRYLLRVDLANFFESITAEDVERYLDETAAPLPSGWSNEDTLLFCQLVCLHGRLTIGAVTSPGLSNALCFPLDTALRKACVERAVVYTRYADDMYFSSHAPNVLGDLPDLVAAALRSLRYPTSLEVNESKTRHSSLKRRRRVTGLVLSTQGTISIGRRLKRRTRSLIHEFDSLDTIQKARLSGWLAYVRDVEPAFFNRLVVKYGNKVTLAARATMDR